uniref:G domain-containing protein n=1 Tax=Rhabditophanes sp. KR3021 TaxID=114890 RepID=A0AC35TH68_9BILA
MLSSANVINCLLFGQKDVGKTSLISKYLSIAHQASDAPQSYCKTEVIDGEIVLLNINKLTNEKDITHTTVNGVDIVMLIFAVDSLESFEYIIKAQKSVQRMLPKTPMTLIATKRDKRACKKEDDEGLVQIHQIQALASSISAYAYFECTSDSLEETKLPFIQAIKIAKLVKRLCNEKQEPIPIFGGPIKKAIAALKKFWTDSSSLLGKIELTSAKSNGCLAVQEESQQVSQRSGSQYSFSDLEKLGQTNKSSTASYLVENLFSEDNFMDDPVVQQLIFDEYDTPIVTKNFTEMEEMKRESEKCLIGIVESIVNSEIEGKWDETMQQKTQDPISNPPSVIEENSSYA